MPFPPRRVPPRVDDRDEVEQAGERRVERADLVEAAEGALVARVFVGVWRPAATLGRGIGDFHRLVEGVGAEGHGADARLAGEPPEVILPIDGVDPPDEDAGEEEGKNGCADEDAAADRAEIRVAEPREEEGEERGDGLRGLGGAVGCVWRVVVGHSGVSGRQKKGVRRWRKRD